MGTSVVTRYGNGVQSLDRYVLTPKNNTYASIIATLDILLLSGGGTLKLEPKIYDIGSNYIPIYSNINYVGIAPKIASPTGLPGDAQFTFSGGTIIQGDGTNYGMWDGSLDSDGYVTGYHASNVFTLTEDTDPLNLTAANTPKLVSTPTVTVNSTQGLIITGLLSGTLGVAGSTYSTSGTDQTIGSVGSPVVMGCGYGKNIVTVNRGLIKDIGFETMLSAIKTGSTNRLGMQFCEIDNVFARDCYEESFSIKNFFHCTFHRMYTANCNHAPLFQQDISQQIIRAGNTVIFDIFVDATLTRDVGILDQNQSRGIVIGCTNNGQLNEVHAYALQCNKFGNTQVTQAATMTGSSADITVTDGTKFVVDQPVSFTTSANGFIANQVYFVISVAGDVIQIADKQGSTETAKTATGATAIDITTIGFPAISVVGFGTGTVVNSTFTDLDMEGLATSYLFAQNSNWSNFEINQVAASCIEHITFRNCSSDYVMSKDSGIKTDFDGNSSNVIYIGNRALNPAGRIGLGIWNESTNANACLSLYYSGTSVSNDCSLRHVSAGGKGFTKPGIGMGQRMTLYTASRTLKAEDCGSNIFDSGSAMTATLPTILNADIHSSMVGMTFDIANVGAGTLTVNTDGTQLFNKVAAKTSYSLTTGQYLSIRAATGASSSLFWQVLATNGT
jgi:hypothetical protein